MDISTFVNFLLPLQAGGEDKMSTMAVGEEGGGDDKITTMAFGEEGGIIFDNNIEKGFKHLDRTDSSNEQRNNGLLEENLHDVSAKSPIYYFQTPRSFPDTGAAWFSENKQAKGILENLYTPTSEPHGRLDKRDYKMNELGKYIAGDDNKISKEELKALDTNNDGKVSQKEYDAKKAEMEEKQKPEPEQNSFKKFLALIFKLILGNLFGIGGFKN